MRKFVRTMLIMLPAVLVCLPWGNVAVSSAYASQKTVFSTPQVLPTKQPSTLCRDQQPGYPFITLTKPSKTLLTIRTLPKNTEPTQPIVESITQALPLSVEPSPQATEAAIPTDSVTSPTPLAGSSGGLNAEIIFGMVNQHRANAGLPAFEKHPEVCSIAESRRYEIENEIYGNSYIHAGFQARSIPYWATENMISQQTETEAVAWWMNSSVHRSALLGPHRYACVICQNKTCAMIFSSLETK